MSGTKERLLIDIPTNDKIIIRGFKNNASEVNAIGKNKDVKIDYYVENMPKNSALLSVNDYVEGSSTVL
jgi:hypothetical protein